MQNKFCRDCVHSAPDGQSDWKMLCMHPRVLGQSQYALASPIAKGVDASDERSKGFWQGRCGRRGALWELKPVEMNPL